MVFLNLGLQMQAQGFLQIYLVPIRQFLKIEKDDFNLSGSSLEVLLVPDFHTWDGQFFKQRMDDGMSSSNYQIDLG